MFIKVTNYEAARFLARGRMIWDGDDDWSGGIKLNTPHRWRKSRKLRALVRKLEGPWNVGGWYVYKKEG